MPSKKYLFFCSKISRKCLVDRLISAISTVLILFSFLLFSSWGFYGHREINKLAVYSLPPEMIGFYKANINYLRDHAVDPDKRRYTVEGEAPKHYIDIDHFVESGLNPFDSVPRKWSDAVAKYGEDTLLAYGIVPWHVNSMMIWLSKAFEEKDANKILSLSAEIGHYISDAHVPLHTTENYNGQLTNQKGIHGLWESRIPELDAVNYDYLVGKASYIPNTLDYIWDIVEESHSNLDSVLGIEKQLSSSFPSDQKYVIETRGRSNIRTYSKEFAMNYSDRMGGMVEKRMTESIINIASFWYTAWVNGGQPDLNKLIESVNEEEFKSKSLIVEDSAIKSREHEH